VVFVGSMFQTDFGEIGQKKRFVVLDTELDEYISVPFQYPELIQINGMEVENKKVKGKYVKFRIKIPRNAPPINTREIRKKAIDAGALGAKIEIERERKTRVIRYNKDEIKQRNLEDLIKDYCKEFKLEEELVLSTINQMKDESHGRQYDM
jgi:glucan-binding YG repeat protein